MIRILTIALALLGTSNSLSEDFSGGNADLLTVGRGTTCVQDGVLRSRDNYAVFGPQQLRDYTFSFDARAPHDAQQVQIWAGFRHKDRFDHYVVGIKGGTQDDVYLMRLGYQGDDDFLGVRPLGFHPEPGRWYHMKVEVCGPRIRVFVGDEPLPYIDVKDPRSDHCPEGPVFLGGSWIDTEFDNLRIEPLDADYFKNVKRKEFSLVPAAAEKERLRVKQRSAYSPVVVKEIAATRTEISLDGDWLFQPEYEAGSDEASASPGNGDEEWHILGVPNFWTPIRIWLHGEQMPTPNGPESKGTSDTYYQAETARCDNYTFDWNKTQAGWYRQWIDLPEGISGKKAVLHFDAVAKAAHVWINGQYAASHVGMFGDFDVDATPYLHPGKNLVAVKVIRNVLAKKADDAEITAVAVTIPVTKEMLRDVPHGFHYTCPPAGIWQPVKLVFTQPLKIEDVFIQPSLEGAKFDMTVSNPSRAKFEVLTEITDTRTGSVLWSGRSVAACKDTVCTWSLDGLKPCLWSPEHPNLYDFKFTLRSKGREADALIITSGFRTFERKGEFLYLNGHRYWLRGGNHIPSALAPNDATLAESFMTIMHNAHVDVTRTHCAPWNEVWMDAADRVGIGVSHEGGWPWLMITGDIPSEEALRIWREEEYDLVRKYRNHPSLLFWTINNEMNFYEWDQDKDRTRKKYVIVSDVVRKIRQIDPTRPICFDSNYRSKGKKDKYGADFMATIDDGDMDDVHNYYNWYHNSLFQQFNGEFTRDWKAPGRCIISQELSTGYPNNETGHPTRSYQITHQNPTSLVGYNSYDWADPDYFLQALAFTTGETAEALRRTNPTASGFLHFALMTWLRNCYDAETIEPYPIFDALSLALQPVLVSAELWGRHYYAGDKLPVRICIVNDKEDGSVLAASRLRWEIVSAAGKVLKYGICNVPEVEHYTRCWMTPEIVLPHIEGARENAKLRLRLSVSGVEISHNEYDLVLGTPAIAESSRLEGRHITAPGRIAQLDAAGVKYDIVRSPVKGALLVVSSEARPEASVLRKFVDEGGHALVLGGAAYIQEVFPEYISDYFKPYEGDICFMERNEDAAFDGLGEMDLRYWNDGHAVIPTVCDEVLHSVRRPEVEEIAGHMQIHAYIDGKPQERMDKIRQFRGFTVERIRSGKGSAIVSTMRTDKASTDPLAARFLVNLLNEN